MPVGVGLDYLAEVVSARLPGDFYARETEGSGKAFGLSMCDRLLSCCLGDSTTVNK